MPALGELLCAWYEKNKRNLPWRKSKNPYAIWLSEIMLQQTTVKAVIPYYEKFLSRYPTAKDLAQAHEDQILALWSGLGYYSRARNLHAGARQIAELGEFPKTYSEIIKLKGVGPYTAAAIASIAFGEKVAVVDGNVIRLISRICDISEDVALSATQLKIKAEAGAFLADEEPSVFNQAMMELGATICTPKNPACLICPLTSYCTAFKNGTQSLRPVKSRKIKFEPWLWELQLIFKKGKIALVRTENGTPWLKNTWVLPGKAQKLKSLKPQSWDLKHSITKHNIFVVVTKSSIPPKSKSLTWVELKELENFGVSSIVKKVLNSKKAQELLRKKS